MAPVCGPFVDIYRGWSWEIAVVGHIVQRATSPTNRTVSRTVTVVVVVPLACVYLPPPFEIAGPILMTSSLGAATNGPKDPSGS